MIAQSTPRLILIGGPNGAGKTTAAMAVLPDALRCLEFLNADEIARGLSPFNPSSVRIQASKLLLDRAHQFIHKKVSFGFESTLAASTPEKLIREAQANGYHVLLLYFGLNSAELAIQRVKLRVAKGGHHIPEEDIRRRFDRSVSNLQHRYLPLVDGWAVYDNSGSVLQLLETGKKQNDTDSNAYKVEQITEVASQAIQNAVQGKPSIYRDQHPDLK